LVFAKLKLGNKFYGVQPFIVKIRDAETHHFVPGVEGGDIGPKFGY
jgi:acyl-CoA oxidase